MAAIMKIVLGHNAAADFSEILRGKKQFSQKFGNGTDTPVPQIIILMQFGLQQAGSFRIVSDTLVCRDFSYSLHIVGYMCAECIEQAAV